jgi:Bacterial Ig-like domain (group 3)
MLFMRVKPTEGLRSFRRRADRSRKLLLEPLEGRTLLTAYNFTKIVDSLTQVPDDIGRLNPIGPVYGGSLNHSGTVAFLANAAAVYAGRGGLPTRVMSNDSSPSSSFSYPVIGNSGTVVAEAILGPFPRQLAIYASPSGQTLPDLGSARQLVSGGALGDFFTINSSDTLAYTLRSIYTKNAADFTRNPDGSPNRGNILVDTSSGPFQFVDSPAINDSGTVAFTAQLWDGTSGIFKTNGDGTFTTIADSTQGFLYNGQVAINAGGTVVFRGTDSIGGGIFTSDGTTTTATARARSSSFGFRADDPSINAAGEIAFVAAGPDNSYGIFTGGNPDADKVIGVGDSLDGSTVTDLLTFGIGGLNDSGQIAFSVVLADGRFGVFRADPETAADPFTVTTTADSGPGSLRQAILNANLATSGPINIKFQIPASDPNFVDDDSGLSGGDQAADVFVIQPLSSLPSLNNPGASILLDGRTQTSVGGETNPFGPEVVLDGTIAGPANGLVIASNNNVVTGLDIRNFTGSVAGVLIAGGSSNRVSGCFVGVNATGTAVAPNTGGVVVLSVGQFNVVGTNGDGADDENEGNLISGNVTNLGFVGPGVVGNVAAGNRIGTDGTGTMALSNISDNVVIVQGASFNLIGTNGDGLSDELERNVIVGGFFVGVAIYNDHTDYNVIAGNYIGLDVTGTHAIGNGVGVAFGFMNEGKGAEGTQIVGNVISGNGTGIGIDAASHNTLIAGNLIGTNATGTASFGNGYGITINGFANTVGGSATSARNVISGNNGNGVTIVGGLATGNAIRGNLISGNLGLGIDLGNDGVTLNDSIGHSGPNLYQNFPVLSSAIASDVMTILNGSLAGQPNTAYHVDFFSNATTDASGFGEGQTFLKAEDITTNSSGQASFSVSVSTALLPGSFVASTATDPDGNTSEFSANVRVLGATMAIVQSSAPSSVLNQPVTFTARISAMTPDGPTPSGAVAFYDGATALGTATLDGGVASLDVATLKLGNHAINATYSGDANFTASTAPSVNQIVLKDNTATSLVVNGNPSVYGQGVTMTASVAPVAPGSGSPSGSVSFYSGSTKLGTTALSAGIATFTTTKLQAGQDALTAVYSGNTTLATSTSPVWIQTVDPDGTMTTLAESLNPTVSGQALTFTAIVSAVAPGSGTPTGTVTFYDGTTALGTKNVAAGTARLATSNLMAGSHSITAVYNGTASFISSSSAVSTQTVAPDGTTSVVTASINPSVFGQAFTFTVTVSAAAPGSGNPTGIVTFLDGSTTLGTATLRGGKVKLAVKLQSVGEHAITAVYSGDDNFTTSTAAALDQVVNVDGTTTTIASSKNPSVAGQLVNFNATVRAAVPGSGTPSGTLTFFDGTSALGTVPVSNGRASLATKELAVGAHSIIAVYNGDDNFTTSTAATLDQVVNVDGTSTTLASSKNPSVSGQLVTFTATVKAAAPGSGTPSGTVTFYDGTTVLGVASVDGTGHALWMTSSLSVGPHAITAAYGGAVAFTASTSASLVEVVNQAGTTTNVVSSANPSVNGQDVTFTVTVNPVSPGSGTPTGSVTFMDGSSILGIVELGDGMASLTISSLSIGLHKVTAVYGGDSRFKVSASAILKQVVS